MVCVTVASVPDAALPTLLLLKTHCLACRVVLSCGCNLPYWPRNTEMRSLIVVVIIILRVVQQNNIVLDSQPASADDCRGQGGAAFPNVSHVCWLPCAGIHPCSEQLPVWM